ncbi:MAG TPA: hypothetical protein DC034_13260 [Clostridium sp.]|jgi:uncharacterized membrane protein|nr:hypothetical protein [Clostridium sp.]
MIKISFFIGLIESAAIFIICVLFNRLYAGFKILGIIGLFFLVLSAILSGSLAKWRKNKIKLCS